MLEVFCTTHCELLHYTHAITFVCILLTASVAVQVRPLLEGGLMTEHTPEFRVTALVQSGLVSLSDFTVQGKPAL